MSAQAAIPANYWFLRNSVSASVADSTLQRLAGDIEAKTLRRGDLLFPSLSPEAGFCILFEGSVGVCRVDPVTGKEIILYIVKPGEFFGQTSDPSSGVIDGQASMARALKDSRVGYVDKSRLRRLMHDDGFRREIQRNLESRVAQLENRMEELLFNNVKSRLARLLLRLSRDFAGDCPNGDGVMIDMSLTQSDIACLIAASREITSLTLNQLRRAGVLDYHDRRICVHQPAALRDLSATNA